MALHVFCIALDSVEGRLRSFVLAASAAIDVLVTKNKELNTKVAQLHEGKRYHLIDKICIIVCVSICPLTAPMNVNG